MLVEAINLNPACAGLQDDGEAEGAAWLVNFESFALHFNPERIAINSDLSVVRRQLVAVAVGFV